MPTKWRLQRYPLHCHAINSETQQRTFKKTYYKSNIKAHGVSNVLAISETHSFPDESSIIISFVLAL